MLVHRVYATRCHQGHFLTLGGKMTIHMTRLLAGLACFIVAGPALAATTTARVYLPPLSFMTSDTSTSVFTMPSLAPPPVPDGQKLDGVLVELFVSITGYADGYSTSGGNYFVNYGVYVEITHLNALNTFVSTSVSGTAAPSTLVDTERTTLYADAKTYTSPSDLALFENGAAPFPVTHYLISSVAENPFTDDPDIDEFAASVTTFFDFTYTTSDIEPPTPPTPAAPVPLPAGVPLVLSALGLLGAVRHLRRARCAH